MRKSQPNFYAGRNWSGLTRTLHDMPFISTDVSSSCSAWKPVPAMVTTVPPFTLPTCGVMLWISAWIYSWHQHLPNTVCKQHSRFVLFQQNGQSNVCWPLVGLTMFYLGTVHTWPVTNRAQDRELDYDSMTSQSLPAMSCFHSNHQLFLRCSGTAGSAESCGRRTRSGR